MLQACRCHTGVAVFYAERLLCCVVGPWQALSRQNQALWGQVQQSESRQALIMDKVSRLLQGMMVAYSALRGGGASGPGNRLTGAFGGDRPGPALVLDGDVDVPGIAGVLGVDNAGGFVASEPAFAAHGAAMGTRSGAVVDDGFGVGGIPMVPHLEAMASAGGAGQGRLPLNGASAGHGPPGGRLRGDPQQLHDAIADIVSTIAPPRPMTRQRVTMLHDIRGGGSSSRCGGRGWTRTRRVGAGR